MDVAELCIFFLINKDNKQIRCGNDSPFLDWKKYEIFSGCRCGGSCGLRKVNIRMGKTSRGNC